MNAPTQRQIDQLSERELSRMNTSVLRSLQRVQAEARRRNTIHTARQEIEHGHMHEPS